MKQIFAPTIASILIAIISVHFANTYELFQKGIYDIYNHINQ